MKRLIFICGLFVVMATYCPSLASDINSEEQAIQDLILKTSKSYHNLDFNTYQEVWLHRPYVMRMSPTGNRLVNWDSLALMYKNSMQSNLRKWDDIRIDISNFHAFIDGDFAWVVNDQHEIGLSEEGPDSYKIWAIRVLQKEHGQWKHAFLITGDYPGPESPPIENDLNNTGYTALRAGQVEKAIEIFQLNVKLFPDSWNAYDSLGEAFLIQGDKEKAIKSYKKSLLLNPKNKGGKEALETLKAL